MNYWKYFETFDNLLCKALVTERNRLGTILSTIGNWNESFSKIYFTTW